MAELPTFSISVSSFAGETIEIDQLRESDGVPSLFEKVAEALDVTTGQVALMLGGQLLGTGDTTTTLSDVGIVGSSSLIFVLTPWLSWSSTIKSAEIEVREGALAVNIGSGYCPKSVWSAYVLPTSGCLEFCVVFTMKNTTERIVSQQNSTFVGVSSAYADIESQDKGRTAGSWGLCCDSDSDCLRSDGEGAGVVPLNGSNKAFSGGEILHLVVDMDATPRTLHFYRNKVPLGHISGFPGDVRLIATLATSGNTCTLSRVGEATA